MPWYEDGLRFECTQCGACCTGDPGYVWVTPEEALRIAALLDVPIAEFYRRYTRKAKNRRSLTERANGDCIFFDRGCTIYPARPKQCRAFPFWPENLRSETTWEEVASECPGVGRGRIYSPEEIQLIRRGEQDAAGS